MFPKLLKYLVAPLFLSLAILRLISNITAQSVVIKKANKHQKYHETEAPNDRFKTITMQVSSMKEEREKYLLIQCIHGNQYGDVLTIVTSRKQVLCPV